MRLIRNSTGVLLNKIPQRGKRSLYEWATIRVHPCSSVANSIGWVICVHLRPTLSKSDLERNVGCLDAMGQGTDRNEVGTCLSIRSYILQRDTAARLDFDTR
jgi:hypothetical protein